MDYNWEEIEERLSSLTVRQLRKVGGMHFNGCLGGASAKADIVSEMLTQMQSWQRNGSGHLVSGVLMTLAAM